MYRFLKPAVAATCLLLAGCNSTPPQPSVDISPEQVQRLTDLGQLQSLQTTLATQLIDKDPQKVPSEFALLDNINQRIAALHTQQLERNLKSKRLDGSGTEPGVIPLPELRQLREQLTADSSLTAELLPQALAPLRREEALTENRITALQRESSKTDLTAEARASVYHQLYQLTGEKEWQEVRDRQMDAIIKAAHAAAEKNVFTKQLEERIDFVRSIYREQPAPIIEDMQGLYAGIFTRRILNAQAKPDPDAAFAILQDLTRKPDYAAILKKMHPAAESIATEYAAYVSESIERNRDPGQSFRLHRQEIEVRRMLGLPPQAHPQTAELARQLFFRHHALAEQNPFGALGLLYAAEVVEPNFPELAAAIARQHEVIKNATINSVSVVKFRSRYEEFNFGELITSHITQRLHETLGNNIQLIDQESASNGVTADAAVTGNILEVKVDKSQTRNKKQIRVTVGENQRPNPAYIAWLELPPKERAKVEKPDETIRESKQENIFITSTLHRKIGVVAVSYRLVSTKSNRVIFPDSITLQAPYEDESSEGIEVGELVIPYKVANLPADTEILHKLAEDVSEAIAANLIAVLHNQELEYVKIADKFAAQNQCAQEVENIAKAATLLHLKKGSGDAQTGKLRERLIDRTLACR
jgi:hypothetical protein